MDNYAKIIGPRGTRKTTIAIAHFLESAINENEPVMVVPHGRSYKGIRDRISIQVGLDDCHVVYNDIENVRGLSGPVYLIEVDDLDEDVVNYFDDSQIALVTKSTDKIDE